MAAATGRAFAAIGTIAAPCHTAGKIHPRQLAVNTPPRSPSGHTGSCAAADYFLPPPSPA